MKKTLITLAVLAIFVITGLMMIVLINSQDIPPPDFSDLKLERPEIAPEKNAFTYFLAAANSSYWPENEEIIDDYLSGKSADSAVSQEVIDKNREVLELIDKGLACEMCLLPEVLDVQTDISYLKPFRNLGKILSVNSQHNRLAENNAEATNNCIQLLKFGDMIQRNPEAYIVSLIGYGILWRGLEEACKLSQDGRTSREDMEKLSKAMCGITPLDTGLERGFKGEFKFASKGLDDSSTGKVDVALPLFLNPKNKYYFNPNKTKLIYADIYRNIIKNAPLCYAKMELVDPAKLAELDEIGKGNKFIRKVRLMTCPNLFGKFIIASGLSPKTVLNKKTKDECHISAARLIVACNLYLRDKKTLPDSLDVLVPEYLPAVPADPYDGKLFRACPI